MPYEIPNYALLSKLGEGAMAEVWLAEHQINRRKAAIKILKPAALIDANAEKLFVREGEVLASFDHPNIVRIHEQGHSGNLCYLVMECLQGGDLLKRMDPKSAPVTVGEALGLTVQVAAGLEAAHQQQVVHRDLKPANIMLRNDTTPVLTDFGIARFLDRSISVYAQAQMVVGTVAYMSPEQVTGQELDGRSDLYALGILFFELLTGQRPFPGRSFQELALQHLHAPLPLLPAELAVLQPVLAQLLAKQKEDRYATAQNFIDELRLCYLNEVALRRQVGFAATSRAWSSQLRALGFVMDPPQLAEVRIAQGEAEAAWLAEEKRLAEAARSAEAKRRADEAEAVRLAEEKRQAETVRIAEAKRQAEEAEAVRLAVEKRQAETVRIAEAKRRAEEAEAARIAEEKRRVDTTRIAEVKRRVEAEATPPAPVVGAPIPYEIPGYLLLSKLSEGAMSEVWLAEHQMHRRKMHKRKAAIKIFKPAAALSEANAEKIFVRQREVLGSFDHPNIMRIYDVACVGNLSYLVMEYLPGGTLLQRMGSKTEPVKLGEAVGLTVQIAAGLEAAHQRQVVHTRLKPAKIMLRNDTTPVLINFPERMGRDPGWDSDLYEPQVQITVGTANYMSPEQVLGQELDGRSDLYALGILFFELLTGQLPFAGRSFHELAVQHLNAPLPQLPAELAVLQPVLDQLLAKRKEGRYPTAQAFIDALRLCFINEIALQRQVSVATTSKAWSSQLHALGFVLDESDAPEEVAPTSRHVPIAAQVFIGKRFWLTSALCGLLLPFIANFVLSLDVSEGISIAIIFACWLLPIGWILFPELRLKHGLSRLTYSRLGFVSIVFLVCTALFTKIFFGIVFRRF